MANGYHDAAGRFCSKGEMGKSIDSLKSAGDFDKAFELERDYKALVDNEANPLKSTDANKRGLFADIQRKQSIRSLDLKNAKKPGKLLTNLPAGWKNTETLTKNEMNYAVVSPEGNTFMFFKNEGEATVVLVQKGYQPNEDNGDWAQFKSKGDQNKFDEYEGDVEFENPDSKDAFSGLPAGEYAFARRLLHSFQEEK